MKKNNMLRIASVLLVAVLLSTCAISGAFAKYTTSVDKIGDSARVAKFGITVSAADGVNADDLFVATEADAQDQLTVSGASDAEVVAPGMNGTLLAGFTVTDTGREVAVKVIPEVDLDLADDTGDKWLAGQEYYCPIVITVGTTAIDGMDFGSITEFETAVENAIINALGGDSAAADKAKEYYLGEGAAKVSVTAENLKVTWNWAFDPADEGASSGQDDAKDTKLGEAGDAYISLTYGLTIEQID